MTDFGTYYNNKFRRDITRFFSTVPDHSKHTFGDKTIFTIQYQALTKDFNYLDFLDIGNKAYFGIALYFTVLVDQVCYTYFRQYYDNFLKNTLYPKFVGSKQLLEKNKIAENCQVKASLIFAGDKWKIINIERLASSFIL
jgi:hypothetical protein